MRLRQRTTDAMGESWSRLENGKLLRDDHSATPSTQGLHLKLKVSLLSGYGSNGHAFQGQMMVLSSNKHLIYLCSPYVTSIPEVEFEFRTHRVTVKFKFSSFSNTACV